LQGNVLLVGVDSRGALCARVYGFILQVLDLKLICDRAVRAASDQDVATVSEPEGLSCAVRDSWGCAAYGLVKTYARAVSGWKVTCVAKMIAATSVRPGLRNQPPGRAAGVRHHVFGDEVVATVMVDRLVPHAKILSLKGDSYRLRGKDLAAGRRSGKGDDA
jgi:hypothetical protein